MPGDNVYYVSDGNTVYGSRKRRKMDGDSRSMSNTPADVIYISDTPVKTASGSALPLQKMDAEQHGRHTHNGDCQHEASLRTLQADLEAMRQLITCKICLRFLYEPYALTCGHTYCYGCIMNWMGNDQAQRKKTCPDCRTIIKDQPAPSYLVKEMVLIFRNRTELLPDGETSEEHHKMAEEEAAAVAKDKANEDEQTGGLFQGSFKRGGRLNPILAIRDDSDNVYRCPQCTTEVEGGWCGPCGIRVLTDADEDSYELSEDESSNDSDLDTHSEIDHELDAELREDELAWGAGDESGWTDDDISEQERFVGWLQEGLGTGLNATMRAPSAPIERDPDDYEFSDEDDEDSLDGFIENDEDLYVNQSRETPVLARRRHRRAAIVLSDDDDEEEDDEEDIASRNPPLEEISSEGASRESAVPISDDEETPVVQSYRRRFPTSLPRRDPYDPLDSEDNQDEDDDVDHEDGLDGEDPPPSDDEAQINLANHLAIHGYSPAGFDSDDDESQSDGRGYNNGYDDEDDQSDAVAGMSERAEDFDEDGEDDDSDDMHSTIDGFVHAPWRVTLQNDGLMMSTGTRATSAHDTYRLSTLQPRRNRHVSPARNYASAIPNRSAHRSNGQTTSQRPGFGAGTSSMFQPRHPFQLSSTLDRINRASTSSSRRGNTNRSTRSSAGGVDIGESTRSGSSETLRAYEEDDSPQPRSRASRRRQNMIDLDDSE